jgi:hypothetical protein
LNAASTTVLVAVLLTVPLTVDDAVLLAELVPVALTVDDADDVIDELALLVPVLVPVLLLLFPR